MMYNLGLILISISMCVAGLDKEAKRGLGILKKKIDVPLKSDLKMYLPLLHDILNFYLDSKNDVDLNLEYAIFLLNVVLKRLYNEKEKLLPITIGYSLKHLLDKNNELINFFQGKVNQDFVAEDEPLKKILTLYSNESLWMSQVKRFHIKRRGKTVMKKNKFRMAKLQNLHVYEQLNKNSTPSPLQADYCLRRLAENPINSEVPKKCKLPGPCAKVLYFSSSVGFSLTHRLLLLQFARFGRRCFVQSQKNDSKLEEKLCKHAFSEATFLSRNRYHHGDLMFEQKVQVCHLNCLSGGCRYDIGYARPASRAATNSTPDHPMTFCALLGYFEFLKKSWLEQLLFYRTVDGCFAQKRHHRERIKPREDFVSYDVWHMNRDENKPLLGGLCEASYTSGALTTLALVVKYILEAYY